MPASNASMMNRSLMGVFMFFDYCFGLVFMAMASRRGSSGWGNWRRWGLERAARRSCRRAMPARQIVFQDDFSSRIQDSVWLVWTVVDADKDAIGAKVRTRVAHRRVLIRIGYFLKIL